MGELGKLIKCNYVIGSQTCDLPVCSIVPPHRCDFTVGIVRGPVNSADVGLRCLERKFRQRLLGTGK
jgi:hypothetical protein